MNDGKHQSILEKLCLDYTDGVLWLDPIGSGDLRSDFCQFAKGLALSGAFTTVEEAWDRFNERVVKPVYGVDIPAVRP